MIFVIFCVDPAIDEINRAREEYNIRKEAGEKNPKVEIKSTSVFGGVSDKTKNKEKKDKITLHVNGCSIFGGVDIK